MNVVYFGNTLNRHQVYVADALYDLTDGNYVYVETVPPRKENLSGGKAKSERPYVFRAYEGVDAKLKALRIAREADIVLFGAESLEYEVERMRTTAGLAFEVSERWLKRGWLNLLSPRLLKNMWYYHTLFKNKPLYKLCSSAFGAGDQYRLHSFRDKCYKWGYFTKVDEINIEEVINNRQKVEASSSVSTSRSVTILWCARFLKLKHPELVVKLAQRLKEKGYSVQIDMYGAGAELESTKLLCQNLGVEEMVVFKGSVPNAEIIIAMQKHDIFLFTSDRNEGWGAVLNEAMSNGCTVVASNEIGSVPYLIEDGKNGQIFKSKDLDSLCKRVIYLIDNPVRRKEMAVKAYSTMKDNWSPQRAAENFLRLAEELLAGNKGSILIGPCSKALPIF